MTSTIMDLSKYTLSELIQLKYQIEAEIDKRPDRTMTEWETLNKNDTFQCLTYWISKERKVVFRITYEKDIVWTYYNGMCQVETGYVTDIYDMRRIKYLEGAERIDHYYEQLRLETLEMFG